MPHQTLFVFDIETIPDGSVVHNLTGSQEVDELKLRQELEQYHLDITDGKNAFPRQLFHKIVAISFLEAEIQRDDGYEFYTLKQLRSGGKESATEKELLEGFFKYLDKGKARLVSFNGRTFDLPVLRYRAAVHGIQARWLYASGDKWNGYMSRYSLNWHCDLLDAFSDFGASARVKLNELCAVFGFPGKFGVDGAKVTDMYYAGQIKEIRDYCETDVLNTYLVYLRYMHHRGEMTTESYNHSINELIEMIDSQKGQRPYLGEFLEAWRGACGGKFLL